MSMIRSMALILGSVWILPVGCAIGMVAGPSVMSKMDAREIQKGDALHPLFKVVVRDGTAKDLNEIEALMAHLKEAGDNIKTGTPTEPNLFLLPEPSGRFESESSLFTYSVLEDTGDEQLIELIEEYKDGDNTIWSRYKARRASIIPMSSRMYYFGYMFMAIPYGLGGALALFLVGRLLLHVAGKPAAPANAV